jgi:hypothetical protein
MFTIEPNWLLVVQGGVEKDFGIDWSINGVSTNVPFQSRTGFVGGFSLQHAIADNVSVAASFRFTLLDYEVRGERIGANSYGVAFSLHYSL